MSLHLPTLLEKGNLGDIKSIKKIIRHYKESSPLKKSNIENWLVIQINHHYSSFLHWLAYLGETPLFKALLDKKVNFGAKNSQARQPLHYAVGKGHDDIVELILHADLEVSKRCSLEAASLEMYQSDMDGKTPRMVAFEKQNYFLMDRVAGYQQHFLYDSKRTVATFPLPGAMSISPFSLNWEEVACMGAQYDWISAPTGQLVYLKERESITRFGSGFNIGNDYFLLVGQGVSGISDSVQSGYRISFNYQYPICRHAVAPGIPLIQENLYSIKSLVEHGHCESMDYVVLKLEPKAEKYFGYVRLTATVPPQGSDLVMSHHPAGLPKKISEGTVTEVNTSHGKINHNAHTLGGSSGAPTGNKRTKEVFAVHATNNDAQTHHASVLVSEIAKTSSIVNGILKFGLMKRSYQPLEQSKEDSPEYRSTLSHG